MNTSLLLPCRMGDISNFNKLIFYGNTDITLHLNKTSYIYCLVLLQISYDSGLDYSLHRAYKALLTELKRMIPYGKEMIYKLLICFPLQH